MGNTGFYSMKTHTSFPARVFETLFHGPRPSSVWMLILAISSIVLVLRSPLMFNYLASDDWAYLSQTSSLTRTYLDSSRVIAAFSTEIIDYCCGSPVQVGYVLRVFEILCLGLLSVAFCFAVVRALGTEVRIDATMVVVALIPCIVPTMLDHFTFAINTPLRIVNYCILILIVYALVERRYVFFATCVLFSALTYQGGLLYAVLISTAILSSQQIGQRLKGKAINVRDLSCACGAIVAGILAYFLLSTFVFPKLIPMAFGYEMSRHDRDTLRPLAEIPTAFFDYMITVWRNFAGTPLWNYMPPSKLIGIPFGIALIVAIIGVIRLRRSFAFKAELLILFSFIFFVCFILSGSFISIIFDVSVFGARASDHFGFFIAFGLLLAYCLAYGRYVTHVVSFLCALAIALAYIGTTSRTVFGTRMYYEHEKLAASTIIALLTQSDGFVPGITAVAIVGERSYERRPPFKEFLPFRSGGLDGKMTRHWSRRAPLEFVAGFALPEATPDQVSVSEKHCEDHVEMMGSSPYYVMRVESDLFAICLR